MIIYPLLSCRNLLGLLRVLLLAHDEERQHVRRLAKKLRFSDLNMLTLEAEKTPARRGERWAWQTKGTGYVRRDLTFPLTSSMPLLLLSTGERR